MPEMPRDLLGHELSDVDAAVLGVYTSLRELAARTDLPPCSAAGVRAALAHVAVLVSDLMLDFEHLVDEGV